MNEHCLEYELLTIEEKLLVDKELRIWFEKMGELNMNIVPNFIYRECEKRIIETLKRKETNDRRNRK